MLINHIFAKITEIQERVNVCYPNHVLFIIRSEVFVFRKFTVAVHLYFRIRKGCIVPQLRRKDFV